MKTILGAGAVALAGYFGYQALGNDLPDSCSRGADHQLYLEQDGASRKAGPAWREAKDGQSCYMSEGGGSAVSVPYKPSP